MDRYTSCLKRAFTPNVKTIDGDFDAPFYNLLLRTAQHATGDFKLEPLPSPFAWKTIHLETFLCFKESLKCLELNLNSSDEHAVQKSILDRKDEFISLTTISLTISDTTTLKELEALLSKCSQLEKLDLDFDEWMMSQVKKDTSLQTLALDGSNNPSVVKYLLQKYPNATSVEIASMEAYSVSPSSSSLPKLDAIKGLDHSSVDEWVVDSLQAMKALVSAMENKQTSQVFEELVSLVPFVSSLDVTYRVHEAWKESSELSSFYGLLQVAPEVEELTLEDTDVKDPPSTYNLPHLHRLYCVQFKGAIVDKQVLPSLNDDVEDHNMLQSSNSKNYHGITSVLKFPDINPATALTLKFYRMPLPSVSHPKRPSKRSFGLFAGPPSVQSFSNLNSSNTLRSRRLRSHISGKDP
ncbi:hypothetical protein HMPREF1544_06689 [Mucor circinelloides 1006PhL]|uniref:Uncharacterized protein n=1 Tax=Mucor circinelloides f. circinelloides (strain 1006PhL) TaxID=1220926 RepID=S2JDI0_MUCC1|nr:hypothetical protein HMPREF1544_06689 [Mucor circinelloides 1006PhL]